MNAICGGGSRWARLVNRCPVCKGRHRFIARMVYGGYSSDGLCGGCGTWFFDGEGRRPGKQEAARNRALVRKEWPGGGNWHEIVKETLDETLERR